MMAKTARIVEGKDKTFQNTFVIESGKMTYEDTIRYADSFGIDALANQERFDKYALTEAFFAAMKTKVVEFREVSQDQADGKRTGVGANAEQEAAIKDSLVTYRELDRTMKNHFRNNPAKLAEWKTASHIRRADEPSKDETPPTENPPPETPSE